MAEAMDRLNEAQRLRTDRCDALDTVRTGQPLAQPLADLPSSPLLRHNTRYKEEQRLEVEQGCARPTASEVQSKRLLCSPLSARVKVGKVFPPGLIGGISIL